MDSNQQAILQFLRSQRKPCAPSRIAAALRLTRPVVSASLLVLQSQGYVQLTHGLWAARGMIQSPPPPSNSIGGPGVGIGRNQVVSGAAVDSNSRWSDFRRLCLYYAECLRLDERPYISAYADKRGVAWGEVGGSIDWRALSSGHEISLAMDEELRKVIKSNEQARQSPQMVLGVAIDVLPSDDYKLISPILLIRVQAELDGDVIRLIPMGQPEVNQKWLELRFSKLNTRRDFIEGLGVLPVAESLSTEGDEELEGAEPMLLPSLDESAQQLFEKTKSWWKEYPDLDHRPKAPSLEEVSERGIYNRAVLMPIPGLKYAKKLCGELQELAYRVSDADLDQTALVHIFPNRPLEAVASVDSQAVGTMPVAELTLMNQDQREACEAALRDPLVVVTGPPGTGKSTVVQSVLANLTLQGKTGLFASRNHRGIDAVEPRLNAVVDPEVLMLRPVYPFDAKERRFDWQKVMLNLLCRPQRTGILKERSAAIQQVDELLRQHEELEGTYRDLLTRRDQLSELNDQIYQKRRTLPALLSSLTAKELGDLQVSDLAKLDRRMRRWRQWPAFLRWLAGPIVRWRFQRDLNQVLDAGRGDRVCAALSGIRSARELDLLCELLAPWSVLADVFSIEEEAASVATLIASKPERKVLNQQLEELQAEIKGAVVGALKLVSEAAGASIAPEMREMFAKIRAGLANRGYDLNSDDPWLKELNKAFRQVMPELIRHYPLWAVSNLSVSKALPLVPAVFDLMILDEASQCDIPSMIPLLYRAKRCMVVGDPMQLPHVTQIKRDADMNVRKRFGVDSFDFEHMSYAANSLYHLADCRPHRKLILLRSHYRCHPDIAQYCNDVFYKKALWIRTSDDNVRARLGRYDGPRGCCWTHVNGPIQPASRGCWSPSQIEAVETELRKLQRQGFAGTVGVVTPFAAQANRIRDHIHAHMDRDQLNRWQFLVSTADGFQGDERDFILFSLVGGNDMPRGSLGFLQGNANRFNVAVSRAKLVMHVLGDKVWSEQCGISYVSELLHRCQESGVATRSRRVRTDLIGPVWEPRFAEALKQAGLPVEQQCPAAGYFLDIGLLRDGLKLDVEVDGECHRDVMTGRRKIDDIYRDMILKSLGWQVLRFWVYELQEDFDGCVQRVCAAFKQ